MPTVREWLHANNYFEQAVMYDSDGNEVTSWIDNDPKYEAKVLRVKAMYPKQPWICAKVYTNWKE